MMSLVRKTNQLISREYTHVVLAPSRILVYYRCYGEADGATKAASQV